jgi:hypothetical protein
VAAVEHTSRTTAHCRPKDGWSHPPKSKSTSLLLPRFLFLLPLPFLLCFTLLCLALPCLPGSHRQNMLYRHVSPMLILGPLGQMNWLPALVTRGDDAEPAHGRTHPPLSRPPSALPDWLHTLGNIPLADLPAHHPYSPQSHSHIFAHLRRAVGGLPAQQITSANCHPYTHNVVFVHAAHDELAVCGPLHICPLPFALCKPTGSSHYSCHRLVRVQRTMYPASHVYHTNAPTPITRFTSTSIPPIPLFHVSLNISGCFDSTIQVRLKSP